MNKQPDPSHDPLRKWMNSEQLEPVSPDFTGKVMNKLGLVAASKPVTVEPAISRAGWLLICLISGTILALAVTGDSNFKLPDSAYFTESLRAEFLSRTSNMVSESTLALLAFASVAVLILFSFESWYRTRRFGTAW